MVRCCKQLYFNLIIFLVFIRWPRLLPILDPDYVVKKIIHAVLTDQVYLLLPRSMYLIAALKKLVNLFSSLPHYCTKVTHISPHLISGSSTVPLSKCESVRSSNSTLITSFGFYWQTTELSITAILISSIVKQWLLIWSYDFRWDLGGAHTGVSRWLNPNLPLSTIGGDIWDHGRGQR